jgi:hypothetical protein
MDEALRAAFRATRYCFDSPDGELVLRIDTPNAALRALLRSQHSDCAAVLTAFNPQGRQRNRAANLAAQTQLQRDLGAAGFTLLGGRNEDPAREWVEESFLVIGIDMAAAMSQAARHDQLAFLWTDAASATPRLIETAAQK